MKAIYFDHAATTPVREEVVQAMIPVLQDVFGNPSSVHSYGRKARQLLDDARRSIAKHLHVNDKEIIFTSGGTEADNMAIIGTARANQHKGKHIITTTIEHHAVLHAMEALEKEGFHVTYLPVNQQGMVSVQALQEALTADTILVSVMYANNETGVIQPIKEIGEVLREHQTYFHTDAVQAFGSVKIDVNVASIDLLTISSHKVNGPKGVGCLFAREGLMLHPLQHGGEQERKRRGGTENTAGIHGFQKAVELLLEEKDDRNQRYQQYKDLFIDTLKEEDVSYTINGESPTIPTIVNISFPGMNVEQLLTNFDLDGIAASSGSACTAGSVEPSHVLSAMYGKDDDRTINSIRFSFGMANHKENIREGARKVAQIVSRLSR